jgi:hypothetical protein
MARLARGETAFVHVMNRTVRRCFLLRTDAVTGKNYDHRKVWIYEKLIHRAKHFGLICSARRSYPTTCICC